MASAGRILIIPKGNYDSSVTYEMLDLVKYNGTAWLAKKTVIGIEPSEANSEYWHNMIDIDLTSLENRVKALEDKEDIDLSSYAKQTEVDSVEEDLAGLTTYVDSLETKVNTIENTVNGITTSGLKIATGSYTGTGYAGSSSPNSITFDFEPKVVFLQNAGNVYGCPIVWHKGVSLLTLCLNGSSASKQLVFEQTGNTLTWYYSVSESDSQLNTSGTVYNWVAIG